MKIAFLLSGKPRYIKTGFKFFNTNFLSLFNNIDVFAHAWYNPETLEEQKAKVDWKGVISADDQDSDKLIQQLYRPKRSIIEPQITFDLPRDYNFDAGHKQSHQVHYSMFYGIKKAFELMELHEQENNFKYDLIVRTRYDFYLGSPLNIYNFDPNYYYTTNTSKFWYPFFDDVAVADVIAWGSRDLVIKSKNVFNYLDYMYTEKNVRFSQETLLGYWLHAQNVPVKYIHIPKNGLIRSDTFSHNFFWHDGHDLS
jgi:hypothetical protein